MLPNRMSRSKLTNSLFQSPDLKAFHPCSLMTSKLLRSSDTKREIATTWIQQASRITLTFNRCILRPKMIWIISNRNSAWLRCPPISRTTCLIQTWICRLFIIQITNRPWVFSKLRQWLPYRSSSTKLQECNQCLRMRTQVLLSFRLWLWKTTRRARPKWCHHPTTFTFPSSCLPNKVCRL